MADAKADEAVFRAGFMAGSFAEWRFAAEVVRLVLGCQAREGREALLASLHALGLSDLADGPGPSMLAEDAAEAWAAHRRGGPGLPPLPSFSPAKLPQSGRGRRA